MKPEDRWPILKAKTDPDQGRFKLFVPRRGVEVEEVAEMHEQQDGRCAICGGTHHQRRLYVDHDHLTGEIRGLLCKRCNVGLGMFLDDPDRLASAAEYLRAHHTMGADGAHLRRLTRRVRPSKKRNKRPASDLLEGLGP